MTSTLENQIKEFIVSTQQNASSYNEWMSISEAAKYVGVSYNTFVKFRNMGLKICEIDGIKRVSRKEIDTFLDTHSS